MKTELNTNTKKRTNNIIQSTYIDLLAKTPADKITVRMVCEQAQINRTTFYNYYEDIIDLQETVSDRLFDTLFTQVLHKGTDAYRNTEESVYTFICEALEIMKKDTKSYKAMLCNNTSHVFNDRLYKACVKAMTNPDAATKKGQTTIQSLTFDYMIYGIIGSVRHWLADDCRVTISDMAHMLDQSIMHTFSLL